MKSKKLLKKAKHWKRTHRLKFKDFSLEEKRKRFIEKRQYKRSRQWLKAFNSFVTKEAENL